MSDGAFVAAMSQLMIDSDTAYEAEKAFMKAVDTMEKSAIITLRIAAQTCVKGTELNDAVNEAIRLSGVDPDGVSAKAARAALQEVEISRRARSALMN